LLELGDHEYPKERECHIRTRLCSLASESEERIRELLNLDSEISETERADELARLFDTYLSPVFHLSATIRGILSPENPILTASLVRASAQQLLGNAKSTG